MNRENCILCGSMNHRIREKQWGFKILQCINCGLIFINPMPTNNEIREFYSSGTIPKSFQAANDDNWLQNYESNQREYFSKIAENSFHRSREMIWQQLIDKITRYKRCGTILDVGCGRGEFLIKAKESGFDVWGIEPSKGSFSKLCKLGSNNIFLGDFQNVKLNNNKPFDVILLHHFLEHVTNPIEILEKCKNLLDKNGILIIAVPNANYLLVKNRILSTILKKTDKKKLGMEPGGIWSPEQHLFNFAPNTLKRMLQKCGFEIKESSNQPVGKTGFIKRDLLVRYFNYLANKLYFLSFHKINLCRSFVMISVKTIT